MKVMSLFVVAFLLVFCLGFVMAAQNDTINQSKSGPDNDTNTGNPGNNSGNGTGLTDQNQNAGDTTQNMEQNRVMVQDGEHMGENGNMFKVQTKAENKYMLQSNGVSADCECNMTQEKTQNKTKLNVQLSNGKNAEVKVMPDTASERALERLRLKVCSPDNGCSLELKEVGEGQKTQLAYELKTQRKAKFLGIFGSKMQVKATISAENGEIVGVDKPWWAFLASEPAEE